MIDNNQNYGCASTPNPLTGFPPSQETKEEWLKKIKDNGVEDGTEVLVIGGKDENKVVTFDSSRIYFDDCGVSSCDFLGWYYRVSDDKACKPIYIKYNTESIGKELKFKNVDNVLLCKESDLGQKYFFIKDYSGNSQGGIRNNSNVGHKDLELIQVSECSSFEDSYYVFESARDMFLYLAHQENR